MPRDLTIEEALDYCLTNPDGLAQAELASMFSEYSEHLAPLLALASDIESINVPEVSLQRRQIMKQRVMSAVEVPSSVASLNGNGAHGVQNMRPPIVKLQTPPRTARRWLKPVWSVVAAAAALILFVWWSASSALANSPFYDVKLTTENALLSLKSDPVDQVRGHLALTDARLADIQTMGARGTINESGKAFDSLDYHVGSSVDELNSTTGNARVEIAKALYDSSRRVAARVSVLSDTLQMSADTGENVQEALDLADSAASLSAQALDDAGIPVTGLPTPGIPQVVPATPPSTGAPGTIDPTSTSVLPVGASGSESMTPTPAAASTETGGVPPAKATTTQPTRTSPPPATATSGPPAAPPTFTAAATSTPAIPASTSTSTATASATGTPTAATQPEATLVSGSIPATETPELSNPTEEPTDTPVPPTAIDTDTPAPTWTPVPPTFTETPIPASPTPSVCVLRMTAVSTDCASATCMAWDAQVSNDSSSPVTVGWTVQLQIREGNEGFHTVSTEQGSLILAPGDNSLQGTICAAMPGDVSAIKVWVTVSDPQSNCTLRKATVDHDPCPEQAGSTPPASQATATPTGEPAPSETPTTSTRPTPPEPPTHTPPTRVPPTRVLPTHTPPTPPVRNTRTPRP